MNSTLKPSGGRRQKLNDGKMRDRWGCLGVGVLLLVIGAVGAWGHGDEDVWEHAAGAVVLFWVGLVWTVAAAVWLVRCRSEGKAPADGMAAGGDAGSGDAGKSQ